MCESSHLHASDVDRQHCCEEEHLQEEVRHQPHNSEQTELLQYTENRRDQIIVLYSHGFSIVFVQHQHISIQIRQLCYLDSWHQSEISNEDDAKFSGHVLHDRPALITKAWQKKKQTFQTQYARLCSKTFRKLFRLLGFDLLENRRGKLLLAPL